nr:MAG TPA: Head Tail Connector Protein [Caudoviricetes sp.]
MAYTDYEFYKSKFYGDTVPESDFLKYAERASDRIDQYTFDRLAGGLPDDERVKTKVQKAVCAVADTMYQIDQIKKASMDTIGTIQREDGTVVNKAVSSVSSGNESISYATGSNISSNVYVQASMDKKVENALLLNVATEYLAGVTNDKGICLLYAGL